MGLRTIKKTAVRNRVALDPSTPRKITPAVISSVEATAADTVQITFNTRVMLKGTPDVVAGGVTPQTVSSATAISATVVELTFTGDVQGTNLVVQEGAAGVRTPSGGFIPAGSYAIPTFP